MAYVELELCDFLEDKRRMIALERAETSAFWSYAAVHENCPNLPNIALRFMTLFGCTYQCETLLSQQTSCKIDRWSHQTTADYSVIWKTNQFRQSRERESATSCVSSTDDRSLDTISFFVTLTWLFWTPSVDDYVLVLKILHKQILYYTCIYTYHLYTNTANNNNTVRK